MVLVEARSSRVGKAPHAGWPSPWTRARALPETHKDAHWNTAGSVPCAFISAASLGGHGRASRRQTPGSND